ncbi:MAG TPA: DUF5132 domain-containing protein [Balneolales bacterium]|nr:DUF5132 domain-containing protein [Balneolales bacterium]
MIKKIIGLGVLMSVPLVIKRFRPIRREVIKGGVKIGEHIKEMAAVVGEDFEDLMAEVRMEIREKP